MWDSQVKLTLNYFSIRLRKPWLMSSDTRHSYTLYSKPSLCDFEGVLVLSNYM